MGAISASEGFQPDYGPREVDPAAGVACIGATPWVTNLNVPLETGDVGVGRRIARRLSARGGGLAHVEAMALPHISGGVRISLFLSYNMPIWHIRDF
jgi:glutamate formiminotransferase